MGARVSRVDEREPLLGSRRERESRGIVDDGFYCGLPSGPGSDRSTWCLLCCTCTTCFVFFVLLPLLAMGFSTDRGCQAESLKGVELPYEGQIVPTQAVLVPHLLSWFSSSRVVDIFDGEAANTSSLKSVGVLYEMRFLFGMRYGYEDAKNHVWFEGRYSSFASRLKPFIEYDLERCDKQGPPPLRVVESYWDRSWFCFYRCQRLFRVYDVGKGDAPVAVASFYYDMDWVGLRHMNLTNGTDGTIIARAEQRLGDGVVGLKGYDRWVLLIEPEKPNRPGIPHWATTAIVELDNMNEDSIFWVFGFVAAGICIFAFMRCRSVRRVPAVGASRRTN